MDLGRLVDHPPTATDSGSLPAAAFDDQDVELGDEDAVGSEDMEMDQSGDGGEYHEGRVGDEMANGVGSESAPPEGEHDKIEMEESDGDRVRMDNGHKQDQDYEPDGEGDADDDDDDDEQREDSASPPVVPPGRAAKRKSRAPKFQLPEGVNPEMYGLRRSGRAATQKTYIDSGADTEEESSSRPRKVKKKRASQKVTDTFEKEDTPPSSDDYEDDDDDGDGEYGVKARPIGAGRKRKRTKKRPSPPAFDMPRVSSRNGKALPNYNEDQMFQFSDADDDVGDLETMEAAEEAIGQVCDHRRGEDRTADSRDVLRENMQFLIKWEGYSYLHLTWEYYEFLKRFKGFKKVDFYIARVEDRERFRASNPSREELEALALEIEKERENIAQKKIVERIISQRDRDISQDEEDRDPVQYLIKWRGCDYSEATWEDHNTIDLIAKDQITAYLARRRSATLPAKSASYARSKRPVYKLKDAQPDYIDAGGELKEFQLHGLNWLAFQWSKDRNIILADEMGLGKTIQTCALLSWLFHEMRLYGPFLVVAPLSTIPAWLTALNHWAPDLNVVNYQGPRLARETLRDYEFGTGKKVDFNVLLTTPEYVMKDQAELGTIKYQYLVVDEAHRLKNPTSELHRTLSSWSTANKLFLTGTPLQNNVKELLALLHFLEPENFSPDDEFDLEDEQRETKIKELHDKLASVMLRRTKRQVMKDLPTKSERILRVEMSDMQMHWYKNILVKNYAALSTESNQVTLHNIAMELKKASNHPYIFDGAELGVDTPEEGLRALVFNSGKMILLDKLLTRLRENGHRVLIFSQMVRMLDIVSDYLSAKGYIFQRLDGTIPSDERRRAIDHFNAPGSRDFCFLLSTRAGGLGINLETADTVVIFDSDWNPQNDLQAQARAHRIGQKNHVNVYRFVTKDTIEEDVLERAKRKMVLERAVMYELEGAEGATDFEKKKNKKKKGGKSEFFSRDELSAILQFGATNVFRGDGNQTKLEGMDLDDVLNKAEDYESAPQGASFGGEDFLAQFAVQDVKADLQSWEDIIPADVREKMAKEQEAKVAEDAAAKTRKQIPPAEPSKALDDSEEEVESKPTKPAQAKKRGNAKTSAELRAQTLKPRDLRTLIRGIGKFGDIHKRYDDVIEEARLKNKNRVVVTQTFDELFDTCRQEIRDHQDQLRARIAGGEQITPAVRNRAVLVTFRGIDNVNAETIINHCNDLGILHNNLRLLDDPYTWRVPFDDLKATVGWHCPWGDHEDSMLLIGVWKYGFGNWEAIQSDEKLGLKDSMFLVDPKVKTSDEKKLPNSVHLNRRADYLLGRLREFDTNVEAYKATSSKAGKGEKKIKVAPARDGDDTVTTNGTKRKKSKVKDPSPSPLSPPKKEESDEESAAEDDDDLCPSMDEAACEEALKPIRHKLKRMKGAKELERQAKLKALKEGVIAIGNRVNTAVVARGGTAKDQEKWRRHLWIYSAGFCPDSNIKWTRLQELYAKLLPDWEAEQAKNKDKDLLDEASSSVSKPKPTKEKERQRQREKEEKEREKEKARETETERDKERERQQRAQHRSPPTPPKDPEVEPQHRKRDRPHEDSSERGGASKKARLQDISIPRTKKLVESSAEGSPRDRPNGRHSSSRPSPPLPTETPPPPPPQPPQPPQPARDQPPSRPHPQSSPYSHSSNPRAPGQSTPPAPLHHTLPPRPQALPFQGSPHFGAPTNPYYPQSAPAPHSVPNYTGPGYGGHGPASFSHHGSHGPSSRLHRGGSPFRDHRRPRGRMA